MNAKIILHKHLIPFELVISAMGITGRIEFEASMIKAMEEYANSFKEKVADAVRDLPSECTYEYDEIKFCPSHLGGHNCCKECFSADNI